MTRILLLGLALSVLAPTTFGQDTLDDILPVRGLAVASPAPEDVDEFITFMRNELVPRKVNTLLLRVDFNYQYESHPELRNESALSKADVKKLVAAAREGGIRIIPQVNLLGHQSWAYNLGALLREYPEFDETPHVQLYPDSTYAWPNSDGLYCKSYCPNHPDVHKVVFAVVDELLDAFEADAFHAGMDEVFYIGDDNCPRCRGRDKAELFAEEVTRVRNHLAQKGRELWIWGDRLIDGQATGMGMWEASMNNTYRAIDMIPKDVVICDWHYERADPSAAYFAMKGFRVVTSPWRLPDVTLRQLDLMLAFRRDATAATKDRYLGMLHTIWSSNRAFLDQFYGRVPGDDERRRGNQTAAFKTLFEKIGELD